MIDLLDHRRRLAALILAAVLTLAVLAATTHRAAPRASASGPTLGVQDGRAPWAPEHALLGPRLAALRLPAQNDTGFHIHALLRIFVDGRPVPVPALIGIDPAGRFLAPLHTHDASGIVHIESARPYPFTLAQFFRIWGVRFGDGRIGAYADRRARRLRVFVDGQPVVHPAAHVLRAHDRIVVAFGRPGSSPTIDRTPFPAGL